MTGQELPRHASVVVIGGGIMGCSTLYHLARAGVSDAVLLERNKLTSGTTWHSAAQVRALRSSRNLTNLIKYSIDLYDGLEDETGQATGWINQGSLSIATSKDRLTHILRQKSLADSFSVAATAISAGEAKERWPLMNADDVLGAVWSPDDGRVNPSDACAALVKGAKTYGVRILEETAVTGVLTKGGRVSGLATNRGEIHCDAVALCAGLWSRRMAGLAGVSLPVWPCEHFFLLTKPVLGAEHHLPTLSDHDGHLYIRDEVGGLLVGCFEPLGKPIDPDRLGEDFAFQLLPEDWDHFEPMMVNALHRLPVLEKAQVRMLLNGPESFTPDGSFLLGESAETRSFFLGCGMNSVGVATGGGAGMALAHCIQHGRPPFDLREADPKRFPDHYSSVDVLTRRVPEVLGKHYEIAYPGRQLETARDLRLPPLQNEWRGAGARFGQFFGWERPLYFSAKKEPKLTFDRPPWFKQVGREVDHAHNSAALFDLSTFGKILVEGPDAEAFLDRVCANDMKRQPGSVIYTAMLNPRGGFESDLTAQRLSLERYRLYVGTGAAKKDMAWLRGHLAARDRVSLTDESEAYCALGLMGPKSVQIARSLGGEALAGIKFFGHETTELAGVSLRAARLSYVGEAGWELTVRAAEAPCLCRALLDAGAAPTGLYAQTAMRIEKRFLAMGHELDSDLTPLDAGLEFAIAWDSAFVGRDALRRLAEPGPRYCIATVLFDDDAAVPLGNEPIYFDGGIVGQTTSASYGYRLRRPLALAVLEREKTGGIENTRVQVDVAGRKFSARVVFGPAYDPGGLRQKVAA